MHRFAALEEVPTLVAILNVLLVAVGVGLIYLPAGLIAGGTLGLVGTIAYQRAGAERPRTTA